MNSDLFSGFFFIEYRFRLKKSVKYRIIGYNNKQGETIMSINGYRILSLEANTIYEQEQSNGVDIGYKMPEKKNYAYFCLFNNVLDYSLDLIELEKRYKKNTGKKFISRTNIKTNTPLQ